MPGSQRLGATKICVPPGIVASCAQAGRVPALVTPSATARLASAGRMSLWRCRIIACAAMVRIGMVGSTFVCLRMRYELIELVAALLVVAEYRFDLRYDLLP